MPIVTAEISMSLDGFITGPDDSPELGLGRGGEQLHEWVVALSTWRERHGLSGGEESAYAEIAENYWNSLGATIMGKRMFDHGEEPWGDEPPFHMPVFVVTHDAREPLVKAGGTTFTFVSDGIDSALNQARAAAGDKNVGIAGGANIIQQFMNAGLLDELHVHQVPVLLGGGKRLLDHLDTEHIDLEQTKAIGSPGVTHLSFRVGKKG